MTPSVAAPGDTNPSDATAPISFPGLGRVCRRRRVGQSLPPHDTAECTDVCQAGSIESSHVRLTLRITNPLIYSSFSPSSSPHCRAITRPSRANISQRTARNAEVVHDYRVTDIRRRRRPALEYGRSASVCFHASTEEIKFALRSTVVVRAYSKLN